MRLRDKWKSLLKAIDPSRNLECVTFGRIYSGDPIDCGNPRCPLCSFSKVIRPKERRANLRVEERDALDSLD
jgi:hypothetical protein